MNMNFYSALHRAHTGISSFMAGFSTTFSPVKDTSFVDKLVADLVGLGFALLAGPAWNIGMALSLLVIGTISHSNCN
jgi:hypothetical protein